MKSLADLEALKEELAKAAQEVYQNWDQSGPDGDPELGWGGVCQDIAAAMSDVLNSAGIEASTIEAQVGEQHVFVVAQTSGGVYEVDISPYIYETGGGYNWKKKQGVTLGADDVSVTRLDSDPAAFVLYAGTDGNEGNDPDDAVVADGEPDHDSDDALSPCP
jgi:transglutaminase-like putative cysteine protease